MYVYNQIKLIQNHCAHCVLLCYNVNKMLTCKRLSIKQKYIHDLMATHLEIQTYEKLSRGTKKFEGKVTSGKM